MELNGPALREIRRRTPGMSVTKASACVGVSQPTWSNWERGRRNATAANVRAIVDLLRISDVRAIVLSATPSQLAELIEDEAA